MKRPNKGKNDLFDLVPYGLVVTRAWLQFKGVSRYNLDNWIRQEKLVSLLPGVLSREKPKKLTWQALVCSLQRMEQHNGLAPGGLTALEHHGYSHYLSLSQTRKTIHLYGPDQLPSWLNKLTEKYLPGVIFIRHGERGLGARFLRNDVYDTRNEVHWNCDPIHGSFFRENWGMDEWPLTLATPERAVFEMLADVPEGLSFEHADQIFQGLTTLSPRRLNKLLSVCESVKVKRLFLWFAERHKHPWFKHMQLAEYDMAGGTLGSGKRELVKGGRLDPKYLITVPESMYGQE